MYILRSFAIIVESQGSSEAIQLKQLPQSHILPLVPFQYISSTCLNFKGLLSKGRSKARAGKLFPLSKPHVSLFRLVWHFFEVQLLQKARFSHGKDANIPRVFFFFYCSTVVKTSFSQTQNGLGRNVCVLFWGFFSSFNFIFWFVYFRFNF